MTLVQAIILGIVQGLTEFIPVSSSAHLVLVERLIGLDRVMSPEQITAFTAVIQLGTLAAVIIYFFTDIVGITIGFIGGNVALLRNGRERGGSYNGALLGWYIIIGTLPVLIVGLGFKKIIEGAFTKNLWVIGTSVIVWAILLLLAEVTGTHRRTMNEVNWKDALIVGFAQCFALIPGSSRSGTTIAGALSTGLNRETAARFSFLLSIPAIFGSGLLEMRELLKHHGMAGIGTTNLVVSTIISGVIGYVAIAFLISYLRKNSTFVFIAYRLAIGVLILGLLIGGWVKP